MLESHKDAFVISFHQQVPGYSETGCSGNLGNTFSITFPGYSEDLVYSIVRQIYALRYSLVPWSLR